MLHYNPLEILSHSPEQTRQSGRIVGKLLRSGDVICLHGDLGAGKTTFSAGVGEGWGANTSVTSPTFVIIHEHQRNNDAMRLYHLDAYRITSEADAESIGLEDILSGENAVLIEWADNIHEWLPEDVLNIEFLADEDDRTIIFTANGTRSQALLEEVCRAAGN